VPGVWNEESMVKCTPCSLGLACRRA
jgi:hypothetical protein